jgi:hypothetical protein
MQCQRITWSERPQKVRPRRLPIKGEVATVLPSNGIEKWCSQMLDKRHPYLSYSWIFTRLVVN